MGGNKVGAAERSQALLSKGQADEDLFPHLDTLVPSNLGALGVVSEAFRILSQHYRAFLLPVFLLALWSLHGFWLSLQIHRRGGLLAMAAWDRPSEWVWAYSLLNLVFSGLSEAAFHRTVVRVYLRENYGEDSGPDESGKAFVFAGLRSIASLFANMIAFTVLTFAIGGLEFLVFSFLDGSALLSQYEPLKLAVLVAGIVFYLAVLSVFFSLFIVSLPASGLTRVCGFQALQESTQLTKGDRLSSFGLYLTVLVLSIVAVVPVLLPASQQSTEVPTILLAATSFWVWLLTVLWYPIRSVLYLKLRAWDKIHDGSRVMAA